MKMQGMPCMPRHRSGGEIGFFLMGVLGATAGKCAVVTIAQNITFVPGQ
jgi:hypothetical protein